MNSYLVVALVALLALSIKTLVLSKVVTRTNLNSAFVVLALSLIAMNAAEFSGSVVLAINPESFKPYLYAVFLFLIIFPVAMLRLVTLVTQIKYGEILLVIGYIYSLILCGLLLTGNLLAGYEVISYSAISVPGTYYDAFRWYGVFILATPITMLVIGMTSSDSNIARRSKITLSAILPICLVGLGVTALKFAGFNASTAFGMPVATTIFLWILMLDERDEFVTLQIKWRVLWRLGREMKGLDMVKWNVALEKLLIEESLISAKYNQSAAARITNTNQSTFHRRMTKHGINDAATEKTAPAILNEKSV